MAQKKTVLVVDDSRMTRFMIKKFFADNYPDWEVLEAANGAEALQIVETADVDIMTLDVSMPGMDGVTLGVEMRKRFPDASIALFTANIQQATQDKAKAAGLYFLPKPLNDERIQKFINHKDLSDD
ncbi:MAG: response regulator [Thermodesulfobacteriota bacterium]